MNLYRIVFRTVVRYLRKLAVGTYLSLMRSGYQRIVHTIGGLQQQQQLNVEFIQSLASINHRFLVNEFSTHGFVA